MKEIVLDTETTGLSFESGHRLVEIGCVELVNGSVTDRIFHCYVNPEREMPQEAFRVHGLSSDFLKKHLPFAQVVHSFLDFIKDSRLIIHNARFDLSFLNGELNLLKMPPLQNPFLDTVALAKKQFPGAKVNLDALCRHFKIDLSAREHHGALLDARLLSEIYIELTGGRQKTIFFQDAASDNSFEEKNSLTRDLEQIQKASIRTARSFSVSSEESAAYQNFLQKYIL
jgi:DNA polymerase III subunit epsilon